MRILVDGYGDCLTTVVMKLVKNHGITSDNIYVKTYLEGRNSVDIASIKDIGCLVDYSSYKKASKNILRWGPDLIISAYAREKIPEIILDFVEFNSFNFHPSLLPRYKGCFSGPWAIINGEEKTGITIHRIGYEYDSGDILYQRKINIDAGETAYSLYHKFISNFCDVFDAFFKNYNWHCSRAVPMPEGGEYYGRKLPFDGFIDLSWDDVKIDAFIRAMHFPPYRGALVSVRGEVHEVSSMEYFKELMQW